MSFLLEDIEHNADTLQEILFIFSVQHDCCMAKCEASDFWEQVQERQVTSRKEGFIKHQDDNNFVINMYAIHNATLLRKSLPHHLTAPKLLYSDRRLHHGKVAAGLRVSQTAKRVQAQAKRKETQARNAEKKRKRQEAMESDNDDAEVGNEEEGDEDKEPPVKRSRNGKGWAT